MEKKKAGLVAAFALASCAVIVAQDKKQEFKMPTGYAGITHEMSEFYEPVPPVVTPGTEMPGGGFTAPSDAIILFDGKDLSAWESPKGGPAEWDVHDGVFTVNKKKGDIQTKQKFTDFINYDKVEEYRHFGGIRNEEDYLITETGARRLGKKIPLTPDEVEAMR